MDRTAIILVLFFLIFLTFISKFLPSYLRPHSVLDVTRNNISNGISTVRGKSHTVSPSVLKQHI